jgi:glutamine amidotransferase
MIEFVNSARDADQSMCRLYAFSATEPTKVECTLVHAQNALMAQSRQDLSGHDHTNGWGIATYEDGRPHLQKQSWAAYHGEHFQRAAAKTYSRTVLAHIRRATVGASSLENTHPFVAGQWTFAHNGTVPGFSEIRPKLLALMSKKRAAGIRGETDSEHVFAYLLSLIDRSAKRSLEDILIEAATEIAALAAAARPDRQLGLNVILTDGERLCGTCLGRTLYHVERNGLYDCEICGFPHIHHDPKQDYWGMVVASEPITQEVWAPIPDGSVWTVSRTRQSMDILPIPAIVSQSSKGS